MLALHAFMETSRANGPGLRCVVWVQGCTLGCPGCYNPTTHPAAGGEIVSVDDLYARVAAQQDKVEGLTVSGGEPLQQIPALTALLRRVRHETHLSVVVFTGYTLAEARRKKGSAELLETLDVLIAGRYRQAERLAQDLRGSANKQLHFLTARYTAADFENLPAAEVVITSDGQVFLSGIDPIKWAGKNP
jgi:anaerobic ribonucleoside-triphosphate reductase activating protein